MRKKKSIDLEGFVIEQNIARGRKLLNPKTDEANGGRSCSCKKASCSCTNDPESLMDEPVLFSDRLFYRQGAATGIESSLYQSRFQRDWMFYGAIAAGVGSTILFTAAVFTTAMCAGHP